MKIYYSGTPGSTYCTPEKVQMLNGDPPVMISYYEVATHGEANFKREADVRLKAHFAERAAARPGGKRG